MRPRVFPAEDSLRPSATGAWRPRFNEAAGIPRGRLDQQPLGGVAALLKLQ